MVLISSLKAVVTLHEGVQEGSRRLLLRVSEQNAQLRSIDQVYAHNEQLQALLATAFPRSVLDKVAVQSGEGAVELLGSVSTSIAVCAAPRRACRLNF